MENVLTTERVPVKMWLKDLEESALQQAKNIANLPFVFSHVALMPDAHMGFGMPIGGVLATKGVIVPNAVGSDINCGMCACKLPLNWLPKDKLLSIVKHIKEVVPVGMNHQKDDRYKAEMPSLDNIIAQFSGRLGKSIVLDEFNSAARQLGTLGGGK